MTNGQFDNLGLREIFGAEKLQVIQEAFTLATGFAAVFADVQGNRITKSSGECRLCTNIIKRTEIGLMKCLESDHLFTTATENVQIRKCLGSGLIDAVVWIKLFGRPIGKWCIGQVMDEKEDIEKMLGYADVIGVSREEYRNALNEVKRFSMEQIENTCRYLDVSGKMLSDMAESDIANRIELRKREKAEAELAQSNEYYKLLYTSMLNGYAIHEMIYDGEGKPVNYRFIDVNPAFEKLTNQKREDVVGKTILDVSPKIEKFWIERYGKVQKTGESITFTSYTAELERFYEVYAFRPQEGRFATIFNDVTEKMEAQEKAHQKQRLDSIGILAGGVAHEINNPINGIINYGQLLLDSNECGEENREYVTEIIKESGRISSIVKNLLQFSRYDSQNHSLARVEDIINNAVTLTRTILKSDQITINVSMQKDMHPVKCRSNQIQQVIINLLINARDSLNKRYPGYNTNKVIMLDCQEVETDGTTWMTITIEDKGVGIPKSIQSNIFEPFFTTKSKNEGTGLGLSISHGIIAEHKGRLNFKSAEGKYTKFFVELPIDNGWEL
ncbi:MAG: PocR ligand-binding domain-containing protein [Clostridia bacterium]|nr:PocR ligand-binding domain-containing protein [Clostridia bacterium]